MDRLSKLMDARMSKQIYENRRRRERERERERETCNTLEYDGQTNLRPEQTKRPYV